MKKKLSVTIDEEALKILAEAVKEGSFRNKSHVVEFSLNKLFKERMQGIQDAAEEE